MLTFRDHYNNLYTIHAGEYKERSNTPKWDGASNTWFVAVKLMGV